MTLTEKIATLVTERGWNQDEFARRAGLNRNTVRQLLLNPQKRLRNQTLRQCADALGLPVHDLREQPLEKLLSRVRREPVRPPLTKRLEELAASQPELLAWLERHPERAVDLRPEEIDELASLQGVGGPLTQFGVEHFVKVIERRRELRRRMEIIAGTEYLELLEQMIDLIYHRVKPQRERP